MQAHDVLRALFNDSGMSMTNLSRAIGKSDKFISRYLSGGTTPGLSVTSQIADVCGYDLKLEKRDGTETIIIDPPHKE